LCLLFGASFSFAIICSFSIAFFALTLLWTPKLRKCSQPLVINKNNLRQLPHFFFVLKLFTYHIHFFTCPLSFN
jgi:hypothetical protein